MAHTTDTSDALVRANLLAGLRRLLTLPDWLRAALDGAQVQDALARHVPELAAGQLRLTGCKIRRLVLTDTCGHWVGTYQLTVEELPGQPRRQVALRGVLTAPGHPWPDEEVAPVASLSFATPGWSCDLPELRLHCELAPPELALAGMELLTDPAASRDLLERSIRVSTPVYQDLQIAACTPQVLSYKPGSRCTIRYALTYPPTAASQRWPSMVIAKAYRNRKGERAYNGMVALWRSPLAASDVVQIAEPLAYIPELRVLVQRPVPEETTLEALLRSALYEGTPAARENIERYLRKAALGLATLHQSGARTDETVTWEARMLEIPELGDRLAAAVPELAGIVAPLVAWLHALAAVHPAVPVVPTHGTFSPEQVLIAQGQISFIDFDNFCMAEPALDVGRFCAALMDSGMPVAQDEGLDDAQRQALLERLDALRAIFVDEYAAHMPIARARVELWEARDYLRDVLHGWIKAKPAGLEDRLRILELCLQRLQQRRGVGELEQLL